MTRILAPAALAALLAAAPALASDQLRLSVSDDLRRYGFTEVDVARLDAAQLAAIHAIANGLSDSGGRRAQIASILGGRNTLRGLFR